MCDLGLPCGEPNCPWGRKTLEAEKVMRDLRDPQKLGAFLLAHRGPLTTVYDSFPNVVGSIEDVSKDDSMGKQCVRDYRAELTARAEEGDKYAASALESLNQGKGRAGVR